MVSGYSYEASLCHSGLSRHLYFLISGHCDARGWVELPCWLSKITKLRLNPVWQRMLCSCTFRATAGVKGLKLEIPREMIYRWHRQYSLCALCWNWFLKRTTSESTPLNRRASVKKWVDFSFFWFLFLCYGVEFVYFVYVAYRAVDILACDLICRFFFVWWF